MLKITVCETKIKIGLFPRVACQLQLSRGKKKSESRIVIKMAKRVKNDFKDFLLALYFIFLIIIFKGKKAFVKKLPQVLNFRSNKKPVQTTRLFSPTICTLFTIGQVKW